MLERSDLTPRDRILMRIHNDIHEMKTGKPILTDSDLYALDEGWAPKNNYEVREYNKYLNIWKNLKYLGMDMQTVYLNAVIDIKDVEKILMLFIFKDPKEYERLLKEKMSEQDQDKILKELLQNTGLDYKSVLYKMTFDSLPKKIQNDALALYPEAKTEHDYLNDEENLSKILKDKKTLTDTEIEKLTDLVMNSISWKYEKEVFNDEQFFLRILISSYFAGVPIKVFIKKLADKLEIEYKDDEELKEKLSEIKDLKHHFREAVKDEVTRGIFFSDYVPLCNSGDYATCNKSDTKTPHTEIIEAWIKAKNKNKKLLQEYVDNGEFVVEERCKKLFSAKLCTNLITGESLYYCDKDLPFIKEYKEQIEQMMVFGNLVHLIKNRDFIKNYRYLLNFIEILKEISETLEKDLLFLGEKYINDTTEDIEMINRQIVHLNDKLSDHIFMNNNYRYYMEIYDEDVTIQIVSLKPLKHESQEYFESTINSLKE